MSISCKNSHLGCIENTMQREQDDGLPFECDMCWEARYHARELHEAIQEMRESRVEVNGDPEALDGDATETLSKVFLNELDELNGNK